MGDMEDFHVQWTVDINTTVEDLWARVGCFDDMSWSEGVGHVEVKEDGKVRTRVVHPPNGGEPLIFEERLLEEPDPREKPFAHAYSWDTYKHPFGDAMHDVVETIRVCEVEGGGKATLGWSISAKVHEGTGDGLKEHATACMVSLAKGLVQRFN